MRKLVGAGLLGYGLCVGAMVGATPVVAQSVSQTTEDAGHPTTNIAQQAGKGIKRGSTGVYHTTSHGTKKVYHKTEQGTKRSTAYVEHHVKPNM